MARGGCGDGRFRRGRGEGGGIREAAGQLVISRGSICWDPHTVHRKSITSAVLGSFWDVWHISALRVAHAGPKM